MPEQVLNPEKKPAEKPFPWRCPKCRQPAVNRVTMPYRCERTHNGRVMTVEVPNLAVPQCSNCGEVVFDYAADEQIRAALQTQFGLAETATSEGRKHLSERAGALEGQVRRSGNGEWLTRSHATMLLLASLALGSYVAVWLWILPDGTRRWFPSMDFIYLNLVASLLGALGLYAAVIVPVVLHALRRRWPFWVCVALSVLFGLLNIGPLTKGLAQAQWASQPTIRVTSHDTVWELLTCAGLLLLYLLAGMCFLSWSLWQRTRAEQIAATDRF